MKILTVNDNYLIPVDSQKSSRLIFREKVHTVELFFHLEVTKSKL